MIRVMHIFAPGFPTSFSGHSKRWLRLLTKWNTDNVVHKILQVDPLKLVSIHEIDLNKQAGNANQSPRYKWNYDTLWGLVRHRNEYDIVHVHVWDWAGLLTPAITRLIKRCSLRELSLVGNDSPSALITQSLSGTKLHLFRLYDAILCISEALREDALQYHSNVHLIMNPVDTTFFSPLSSHEKLIVRDELCLPRSAKILLFVGSIKYRKGVDTLVESFSKVAQSFDTRLVLVGPRNLQESSSLDEDFLATVDARISLNKIQDKIIFTGKIDDDEILRKYYQAADILVFPSRAEGLGNVVLEAMACGLPSVASYLGGITDQLITEGENGCLVPVADEQALATKIAQLISNPKLLQVIGSNARDYVNKFHSVPVWQTHLSELYISTLGY